MPRIRVSLTNANISISFDAGNTEIDYNGLNSLLFLDPGARWNPIMVRVKNNLWRSGQKANCARC